MSIVLAHLHWNRLFKETDYISHIELSLENKTRVDKNENLRRPHKEDLDRNHQLFKLLSVLDTVSKTLKMLSYFKASKIILNVQ